MTRSDRGTLAALVLLFGLAAVDAAFGDRTLPMTAMVLGPMLASGYAGPLRTGFVGLVAVALGGLLGLAGGTEGHTDYVYRLTVVVCAGVLSVVLATSRERRERQLSQVSRIRDLAETLQLALLPTPHIADPDTQVVARYQPGEERLLLGGDFYDVLAPRPGCVLFVIGDVAGHGPQAAALGTQLRAGWRAQVATTEDPLDWLEGLNQLLATTQPSTEMFVTVCAGLLDTHEGYGWIASAGHPAPVLLADEVGPVTVRPGPPLGIAVSRDDWAVTELTMGRQWALLLYTDGLIEGRRSPGSSDRFGNVELLHWLTSLRHPQQMAEGDLDRLMTHVQQCNGTTIDDDVAAVLITHGVRGPGRGPQGRVARRSRSTARAKVATRS